jgi:two-component system response regulator (stage 0 sporulation protein F)
MKPNAKSKNGFEPEDRTILLVDDDAGVREMVGRVLADEGYTVLLAASGPEAIQIAEHNHIDLVLLDLNMPLQDGWDAFEKLTAHDPMLAVNIITARPNQMFTALGAGARALLEKPLDFPKLLQSVAESLAEPAEVRLARLTGRRADFHYHPSTGKDE